MDLSNPGSAVVPTLDAVVLPVLAGTTRPLTGREVHRLGGRGSQRGIQLVLNRLEEHGLVDVIDAGSARLYTLNRDHVAADAATALLNLRGRLFDRMRETLALWPVAPVAAAVFGSAARGDGGTDSDIDVILIRPADVADDDESWSPAVDELGQRIQRWSGNPASIVQVTRTDVAEMVAREAPIVEALRREAVDLTDAHVTDLLREQAR